jgi:LmbE family N-acetylglucosaminyl deacetylase
MAEMEMVEDRKEIVPRESPEGTKVLFVFSHPDDAEFTCGGTIARWSAEGKEITLCIVTDGSRGSDDPEMTPERLVEIRLREQEAANDILGIVEVIYLGRQDGIVVPDLELRLDLVRVFRRVRPDVVVTGDPSVYYVGNEYINHPDHRAVATAALEALFPAAGNRLYFPQLLDEGLEPHKIYEVYISNPAEPDVFVDITDFMDRKIASLRLHSSQMGDWDPDEPIREWNARDGEKRAPPVKYAEDYRYFKISG